MVVVVLNWNGWRDTIESLESLQRVVYGEFQIVVIDNGSQDRSLSRLCAWADGTLSDEEIAEVKFSQSYLGKIRRIPYTVFESPDDALRDAPVTETPLVFINAVTNRGYAGGNNIGLRYAQSSSADFVWLLNNDTVVNRLALAEQIEIAQRDPRIGIVGAKVLAYHQPTIIQVNGGGRFIPPLAHDSQNGNGHDARDEDGSPLLLEHVVGVSLLARVDAVTDVGLMDEDYFLYREETDWCIRMRKRHWKLAYCHDAVIWHKQGGSIGFKSPLHDYYAVRNMLVLLRKFHPAALPTAMIVLFAKSVAPKIARRQFVRLRAVIRAFRDFLCGVTGRAHTEEELLVNRDVACTHNK